MQPANRLGRLLTLLANWWKVVFRKSMNAIDAILSFTLNTRYEDLPPAVVAQAKVPFLDTLGVMLLGSTFPHGKIAIDLVREMGGTPAATVAGSGFRSSPLDAAFANGVSTFAPDFDDFNIEIFLHPSTVLVPAILAAAEATNAAGKDVLAAYIIGWEVLNTIGQAAEAGRFAHRSRGWHPTATTGTMGATAVAARLFGLDHERAAMALGIAGSMAAGTVQQYGSMAFALHPGLAAKNGLLAAMLAKKGITADRNILESPYGYLNLYNGAGNYRPLQPEKMGNPYFLVSPGFGLKKYGCCSLLQCPIEGMQELVKRERFTHEDVAEIRIGIHAKTREQIARHDNANTVGEAQFCEQYHAAVGTLYPDVIGLAPYGKGPFTDPRVRALMKRVTVFVDPSIKGEGGDALYTHNLTVKLKDGREFFVVATIVGGDVRKPLSRAEVLAKYRDNARRVLAPAEVEESIAMVDHLEDLPEIGRLTKPMGQKAKDIPVYD
jgi:2-methylcitrate dehydratase PrpD